MLELARSQWLLGHAILTEENDPELLSSMVPCSLLNAKDVLNIYRQDYISRLTAVLGEHYLGVWSILGDELFFKICREYISQFNSLSFDLGEYGREFPQFLEKNPVEQFPFLGELAHFEKGFLRVFHSPLQRPKSFSFHQYNLLRVKFKFIEGIHLQKSNYPVFEIWNQRKNKIKGTFDLKISNLILYKNESGISVSFFTKNQLELLVRLQQGLCLEDSLLDNLTTKDTEEIFSFISSSGIIQEIYDDA